MTRRHLPIKPQSASRGWRGNSLSEWAYPAPREGLVGNVFGNTRDLPLLVDSREVARLLGIGRTKAFELMARDEIPVVRLGRCIRVSREALEIWIARQASSPPLDPGRQIREAVS